ncbi:hypothetical protein [Erythrobacter sp.]|uniref:hypothetical protein n=1 Tax=Erythrobacter sp. TaxID=1042 RepID=UPI001B153CD0|nr:hypothetical protein [Erythrobacter sp.]MBO6526415.1 hypothetical protein [Erythrobacter sp.]MBO6530314.1 hypothetical protein [Erythrobacter sp.]
MAMTLAAATARLTRDINSSEDQIAKAVAAVGETVNALSLAQIDVPGAPKAEAHGAMLRLLSAQRKIAAAQSEMLRAHHQLSKIGETMTGEEPWCPSDPLTSARIDGESVAA